MSWFSKALTALKAPLMPRGGPLDGAKGDQVVRLIPTDPQGWAPDHTAAGVCVTDTMAMRLSAVWACSRLIASSGGSLPVQTFREDASGELVAAKNTPLYAVVHDSPNADMGPLDYWEFVFLSMLFRGSHYARKLKRGDGTLIGLDPVPPDIMAVRRRPDGKIGYRWSLNGKSWDLTEDDVFHVRGFGGGPLGGLSTISYAPGRASASRSRRTRRRDRCSPTARARRARPSSRSGSTRTSATRREPTSGQFAGAINAGKPFILEGGADLAADLDERRRRAAAREPRWSVEDICRWFGVPPFMIGHNEKTTSWGTGIEQMLLGFVKFTLSPYLIRIEQSIRKQLLTPSERAQGMFAEFNLEGLLRGDSAGRAQLLRDDDPDRRDDPQRMPAEGKPAADPGGDEVMIQSQYVPLLEAIRAALNGGTQCCSTSSMRRR
jgi:HK97 family phage portal protein